MKNCIFFFAKVVRVNGNLNDATIVTSVAGLGTLATGVGGICSICTGKLKLGTGLLISSVGLGITYSVLEKRDQRHKLASQEHQERIAKIKHPNSPADGDKVSHETVEDAQNYYTYKPSEAFGAENDLKPMLGYLLPEGNDALIYGMKGSMKSYFTLTTMAQIIRGEVPTVLPPTMGDYALPNHVYAIYADGENGNVVLKQRLSFFGSSLDSHMDILAAHEFGNDQEKFFKVLSDVCMKKPRGSKILVGVDNLKSLLNDMSQSQGRDYLNRFKKLRAALKDEDISLTSITVHHTDKTGDKVSGSYSIPCLTPYIFRIEQGKDDSHRNLVVEHTRTGDNKDSIYALKVSTEDYTHLAYEHTLHDSSMGTTSEEEERRKKFEQVKAMRESNVPWKEITNETGVSAQLFNNWKKSFAE